MSLLNLARLQLRNNQTGFAYVIGGNLYLALTNQCPMCATTLFDSRGPSFKIAEETGFRPLNAENPEPTSHELAEIVKRVYSSDLNLGSMGELDTGVVFAGIGEPLTRVDTLLETVRLVKEQHNGIRFRINTNGLFGSSSDSDVVNKLINSGVVATKDEDQRRETRIDCISVALMCANPKTYDDIMQPKTTGGKAFGDLCSFICQLAEAGVNIECTAVARPEVDISATKDLALSLGARSFRARIFYP